MSNSGVPLEGLALGEIVLLLRGVCRLQVADLAEQRRSKQVLAREIQSTAVVENLDAGNLFRLE